MPGKKTKTSLQAGGAVAIAIGSGIFMWARGHSPHMGFGEMMMKADSYILKEPVYNVILIIAGLFALAGVINIVKSFQADGSSGMNIAKALGGDGSGLDKIKKAKELLDAGAIDAAEFEKIKKDALGT